MYGSHLSIAGTMLNALIEAKALEMDTVQVFTKNQQQWKAKPLDEGMVREWRTELGARGWEGRVVSHASYLINLASPAEELWGKSVDLMTEEIERCEALGIAFLVHHPGAYTTSSAEEGIGRIASAYRELFRRTRGYRTVCCLEDTVGSGSNLGRTFEELAAIRGAIAESTGEAGRVGFCLDTCHLHAGGYDLSTRAGGEAAIKAFDEVCGLEHLHALHLNDSKGKAGSRLDRHAHIGEGTIGGGTKAATLAKSGFAAFIGDERLKGIPKILETPKENDAEGTPMDRVNLGRLKGLEGGGTVKRKN